jgi:cytochrome oxidase assembly protein ShyY1
MRVALLAQVASPADDPMLQSVPLPELGEGSHLSYAIQWIIFAVCVAVGWILAVRRSIRTRARSKPSA